MITLNENGVEYTVKGYDVVERGNHFINVHGDVQQCTWDRDLGWYVLVVPVPVEHKFGGVVFVETGENRVVENDEWFLSREGSYLVPPHPVYWIRRAPTRATYKILRSREVH